MHLHHAVQITLAIEGSFTLESGGRTIAADAAAVAPDTDHVFEAGPDAMVAHLSVAAGLHLVDVPVSF